MRIYISDEAADWFKEEMQLDDGEAVRFFVKYGGSSPVQQGFSLGVRKDVPDDPAAAVERHGHTFFVESADVWYFDDHDLYIGYDAKRDEPTYDYKKH
ncbi:HesB/YadR/YfhF family protein [Heyndrickxia acidiproducens]|uniref:HesB/YadR/YfhF family protein n=1 Tax=Heyndrickxia acidiproducens TaxID=1121084 RepID=UPI00035DECF8|nr:HesB/YadR/YfhF family protein [Heyndrickxia acidiproducens]